MQSDALNEWEESAVIYKNAQTPSPWTVPTIGSVFTGLRPERHGTGLMISREGSDTKVPLSLMNKTVSTLAELYAAKGYETAIVSASPWTGSRASSLGLTRGFQTVTDLSVKDLNDDWRPIVENWQQSFLSDTNDSNFFHFLHFMDAHSWHGATGDAVNKRYEALPQAERERAWKLAPGDICQNADSAKCRRFSLYVSAVKALRNGVATILQTLEEKALLDDTVVVIFSDHGEEFWDHYGDARLDGEGFPDAAKALLNFYYADIKKEVDDFEETIEAFGHGHTLYQEQLHVPLLIWHPDLEARAVGAEVSLIDVGPSIAQWVGFTLGQEAYAGVYLDEHLTKRTPSADRTFFGSALARGEPQVSALRGNKKAIWKVPEDHTDYYDLSVDPGEQSPLSNDQWVLEFDGAYLDFVQLAQNKEEAVAGELDSEQIRVLQSIGYLQGIEAEPNE